MHNLANVKDLHFFNLRIIYNAFYAGFFQFLKELLMDKGILGRDGLDVHVEDFLTLKGFDTPLTSTDLGCARTSVRQVYCESLEGTFSGGYINGEISVARVLYWG